MQGAAYDCDGEVGSDEAIDILNEFGGLNVEYFL